MMKSQKLLLLCASALTASVTIPAYAASPSFEIPIQCELGTDCFIQNYPDAMPNKDMHDYRCGYLVYDKHDGTDFRLRDYVQMRKGVAVLAAADGDVVSIRNDMDDILYNAADKKTIRNKECGNGVILKHPDGWETQYCHLQKGSVRVKAGDKITAGETLGLVGLSGETAFPHLHFAVRYKGQKVDPFNAQPIEKACDDTATLDDSLWSNHARLSLAYQPTAMLTLAITDTVPEAEKAREGDYQAKHPTLTSDHLITYMDIMGIQRGDVAVAQIIMPDGKVRHFSQTFTKPQSLFFWYVGIKKPEGGWKKGDYRVEVSLIRDDDTVFSDRRSQRLE